MTSAFSTAFWALARSTLPSQLPCWAIELSSQSRYSTVKAPILKLTSSSAILIELTAASVWPLLVPWRGKLLTMTILSAAPVAAGLVAAAAGAVVGAAAGAVVAAGLGASVGLAGAAVGLAAPPQAASSAAAAPLPN